MKKYTRHSAPQGAQADSEEFNLSKLEATVYIGASALATIAVLVWVARNFMSAVL